LIALQCKHLNTPFDQAGRSLYIYLCMKLYNNLSIYMYTEREEERVYIYIVPVG